jgi:hypothetical protein
MQRSVLVASFVLTTLAAAVASAETFDLRHGPRTPAAAGTVDFDKKDKGDNKVSVEVKYLPPVTELSVSKYVVWFNPGGGHNATPVGTIELDKNRNGKLEISTPFQSFDVMVTGEQTSTPMRPSSLVILRGHVGKPSPVAEPSESGQGQRNQGSSRQGGAMGPGQSGTTNPPPAQPESGMQPTQPTGTGTNPP